MCIDTPAIFNYNHREKESMFDVNSVKAKGLIREPCKYCM